MTRLCRAVLLSAVAASSLPAADLTVEESAEQVRIATDALEAVIRKKGYVSGVAGGTFLDRKIEEIGGRPVRAGESFGAAFIVGYFDSVEEMEAVYDAHARHSGLEADASGWRLVKAPRPHPGMPGADDK
jgi:hypothetical protein